MGARVSMTPDHDGGLADSIAQARRSLYAKSGQAKERAARIRQDLIQRQDTILADLFGALTRNRIGWGHKKSYLAIRGNPETEVFANLVAIYARSNRDAWRYVQTELPDLARSFEQWLTRNG